MARQDKPKFVAGGGGDKRRLFAATDKGIRVTHMTDGSTVIYFLYKEAEGLRRSAWVESARISSAFAVVSCSCCYPGPLVWVRLSEMHNRKVIGRMLFKPDNYRTTLPMLLDVSFKEGYEYLANLL